MLEDAVLAENGSTSTMMQSSHPPRNRLLQRSTWASSADGARPQPPPKRRGSLISDFSIDDARQSLRSSTDDLLVPRAKGDGHIVREETSHWQSIPLIFAILPAIGGLFFKDGSAFVTDIMLLGLAAVFLNWSVRMPWEWYHSAQAVQVIEPPVESEGIPTIVEESNEDGTAQMSPEKGTDRIRDDGTQEPRKNSAGNASGTASAELRKHELFALASCFLGPLLGAYMLHAIRAQLSRPSEGLVSNYNLTIFVLAAELRPCSHLIRMLQARTLYLQQVVRGNSPNETKVDPSHIQDLTKRLEELEAHVAETASKYSPSKDDKQLKLAELSSSVRQSVQPQLDALNRAVRRYEKRAMTQTIQIEARLQDLEVRIKDAFSLAAVAAQRSQRPGIMLVILEWMSAMFMFPLQAAWSTVVFPLNLTIRTCAAAQSLVVGPKPDRKKKAPAKLVSHTHVNGERGQHRSSKGRAIAN